MRSMHSWQIRWSLPWLWSELGHMVCTGLWIALDWQETEQMLFRTVTDTFTLSWWLEAWPYSKPGPSPTTKRFWVREVKPTEETAFSQRHGLTSSGVGALEFQTLCFESIYLPSSTSIISSTATATWKLSFFWCKSTWTNSLSEIWSGLGCSASLKVLYSSAFLSTVFLHVMWTFTHLAGFTWPSHQPSTVEMVTSWLHQ